MAANPTQVNVVTPEGELVSIPNESLQSALAQGYSSAPIERIEQATRERDFGTPGQMALTAVEGAGKGLAGPLFTGLELAAGAKPENIRNRAEVNPVTHGVAEVGTFLGSAVAGVGQAKLLGEMGKAAELATGIGEASRLQSMARQAVRGAFETGLYQGGEEVNKAFLKDPDQSAETAITDIGMSTVLGGMFGGAIGAAMGGKGAAAAKKANEPLERFVSELDRPALESGELKAAVEHSESLPPEKKASLLNDLTNLKSERTDAKELRRAGERLGLPVFEGQTTDNRAIQMFEDGLINSPYTIDGAARHKLYDDAYKKATGILDGIMGPEGVDTSASLGNTLKERITNRLNTEYAPLKEIYAGLKEGSQVIPIEKDAYAELSKTLRSIDAARVAPSSPEGQLVKRVLKDMGNVKTVNDLDILKNTIKSVDPETKYISGILRDKIDEMSESAIERFAKRNKIANIEAFIEQKNAVKPQYKAFIEKVSTLSEQLGKGKIHGVQDALHFINEKLTPEQVATRVFAKKDSEFLKFFEKNFPEEMTLVRDFQKNKLRSTASKSGELSSKVLFNKINELEPEIKSTLFSKEEINKLKDLELWVRRIPISFNPSGTSHMAAMRAAFTGGPLALIRANLRDAALEKLIKMAGNSPEASQAAELAKATVKGERTKLRALKSIIEGASEMPSNVIPITASKLKLDRLVAESTADPSKLLAVNDNNNSVDEYNIAFASTSARVVSYLESVRPKTEPQSPLDDKLPANDVQRAEYDRALSIAQQPLVVLKHLKDNRLTPKDIVAIQSMYPKLYEDLKGKLFEGIVEAKRKKKKIPYQTRMGLSIFLGQPLDSTLTPQAIQSSQAPQSGKTQDQKEQQATQNPGAVRPSQQGVQSLNKLPGAYRTGAQARETERSVGK